MGLSRAPGDRVRVVRAVAVVVVGVGVTVLGFFMARQSLEQSDRWASVLGLFVNVAGLVVAGVGVWAGWPRPGPKVGDLAGRLGVAPLLADDPRQIGRFALVGRLGEGTTGIVYLGVGNDGAFAAVKVMRPEVARESSFRERFKREIRDIQRVESEQDEHFPSLLGSGADAQKPWLATTYLPASPLNEVIGVGGPWRLPAVGWFAHGMARAVAAMARSGITHRDLKPSNVLLDDGGPRLIDFGIAKSPDDSSLTRAGDLLGTMAFMAPEQFRGESSAATDVFGLGALLVYTATGKPPFGTGQLQEVMHRIIYEEPDLGPLADTDDPLVDLIRRCLAKEPAERPTPDEIVRDCARYAGDAPTPVLPAELRAQVSRRRDVIASTKQSVENTGRSLRGLAARRKLLAGMTAVAVLVVVGVVWLPNSSSDRRSPALATCSGPADTTLLVASSQEKIVTMRQVAQDYGVRSAAGHCVRVAVVEGNSGTITDRLGEGWTDEDGPRPDVWSPASSVWLTMALDRAKDTPAAAVLPATGRGAIVTSPLVIAVPRPMAERLDQSGQADIGWHKIAELAAGPGWSAYGHPEWGPFLLGKTNPAYSSSGLTATFATFSAFGRHDGNVGLLAQDIDDSTVQANVRTIEQSITHYGQTTLDFLANLRRADAAGTALTYVSALSLDESSMLAYNAGYANGTANTGPGTEQGGPGPRPTTTLVARYPNEGTLVFDHPYIELDRGGMSAAKQAVSDDFFGYLRTGTEQAKFQALGFRDFTGDSGPLATPDSGVRPLGDIHTIDAPSGPVLAKVIDTWKKLRKPATVLILVDVSFSMGEDFAGKDLTGRCPDVGAETCPSKMGVVKKFRGKIVDGFTDRDRVGLWSFSSTRTPVVPVAPVDEDQRTKLNKEINGLIPGDGTNLFDTVQDAVATVRAVPKSATDKTIDAVVVISDGKNNPPPGGGTDLSALVERISPGTDPVRVFTIAYGNDDTGITDLTTISNTTNAATFQVKGATGTVGPDLVAAIVSNF
ncbi:protein kinase domain-containing protein [Actinokineospora inagensis]|uniref:protein kinase domain-containing protein n=1 Tax=Actinokineospora inagensis TaxID=103730 RepID=UPI0003FB2C36|nr:protein kinase [Actinokineospora inagensis]